MIAAARRARTRNVAWKASSAVWWSPPAVAGRSPGPSARAAGRSPQTPGRAARASANGASNCSSLCRPPCLPIEPVDVPITMPDRRAMTRLPADCRCQPSSRTCPRGRGPIQTNAEDVKYHRPRVDRFSPRACRQRSSRIDQPPQDHADQRRADETVERGVPCRGRCSQGPCASRRRRRPRHRPRSAPPNRTCSSGRRAPPVPAADLRRARPPGGQAELEAERGPGEANRRCGRRINPDAGQDGHGGEPPTRDSLSRSAPSVVSRPRNQPVRQPTTGDSGQFPRRAPWSTASSKVGGASARPASTMDTMREQLVDRRRDGDKPASAARCWRTGRPASRGSGHAP